MDDGPFRASRPADRRSASKPEMAQARQAEQSRPIPQAVPVERPSSYQTKPTKKSSKKKLPFIIGIVLALLLIIGAILWVGSKSTGMAIDSGKYQAVFFTNGQVYFGKLKAMNNDYMSLTNIYYLQTQSEDASKSQNPQQTSDDSSNVQLIKLGDEIHGPEDEMILSKDQVLFYENLKPDGKVAQSIEQFKKSQ